MGVGYGWLDYSTGEGMIIRPATLADLGALVSVAVQQTARYPNMKPDRDKIRALATDAISSAQHFAVVAEQDGGLQGALIALTSDNAWAQRKNSHLMLWLSNVPPAGAMMLRRFRDWVRSRRAIKVAGFSPDIELDPRTLRLAELIGFKRHGGAYLLYN